MTDSKVIQLNSPVADSLNEVLKRGAQQLLTKAVEAEVTELLDQYSALKDQGVRIIDLRLYLWARGHLAI